MPLSKYQIRNEYSLADPELYTTADKDDPEALLEGVAMAGLVGVLRQLGDLAEFAAEIFHDLHEEVMATSARGHSLMGRVQQLEVEFPSVEKAFLSQTNHSPFFYKSGADWHPKLHMDQNLITCGDLPRFIMDSYEECRGPPRLFLLDKFDVAGAGACLKRYTDPSFFKVEASSAKMTNAEVQREKRIRRIKKKGTRMRNGETPEVLPAAHAKLHQLFLEERVQNGISDPARRVKLKRRLPAFPLDSQPGTSYMEKFLNTASPEHKAVHEISINSSPLRLTLHSCSDLGAEILEIGTVNPHREEAQKKRSPCSSPSVDKLLNPSFKELHDVIETEEILIESEPSNKFEADEALSSPDRVLDEKEIVIDGETKIEGNVDGYHSEDTASEVDNYMDALTTMESEMETDTEYRTKNDQTLLNTEKVGNDSDVYNENHRTNFSDSQSTINTIASDDGNSSPKQGISNFMYTDTPSILVGNAPLNGDFSAKDFPRDTFDDETTDLSSSNQFSSNQVILVSTPLEDVMSADLLAEVGEITRFGSEFGQASTSSSLTDSVPSHLPTDPEDISKEDMLIREGMDGLSSKWGKDHPEIISSVDNQRDFGDNLPCSTNNLSDIPSWNEVPPTDIAENHPVNELNEDSDAFSDAHTHSSNMLEAPEEKIRETLLDDVHQTEYLEENGTREMYESKVSSSPYDISLTEEQSCVPPLQEPESVKLHSMASEVDNATEPVEDETVCLTCELNCPGDEEQKMLKIADDVSKLEYDFAKADASYSGEQNIDGPANTDNNDKLCEIHSETDLIHSDASGLDVISDVSSSVDLALLSEHCAHSEWEAAETIQLETVPEATAVSSANYNADALVAPVDLRELQEKTFDDLSRMEHNGLEINGTSFPENYEEAGTLDLVRQEAVALPNLSSVLSNAGSDNQSPSDSLDTLHGTPLSMEVKDCLHIGNATAIPSSPEHIGPDSVSGLTQHCDYDENAKEASSSVLGEQVAASLNWDNTGEAKNDLHFNFATGFPSSSERSIQDVESAWQSDLLEKFENASSASTSQFADPITSEKKVDLLDDQLNDEWQFSTEASAIFSQSEQIQISNDMDHEQHINTSPKSFWQPQSSMSDLFPGSNNSDNIVSKKDVVPSSSIFPDQTMVPSSTIFPGISLFPESNQINLEEMPPLPPLPPMLWRMGKLQRSLTPETVMMQDKANPFLPLLPSPVEKKPKMGNQATEGNVLQPSNPATEDDNYCQSLQMQKMDDHGSTREHSFTSDSIKSANPFLTFPAREMPQLVYCAEEEEKMRPCLNPISPLTNLGSTHASGSAYEPINQLQPEANLVDKKIDPGLGTLDREVANPVDATGITEDGQAQQVSTTSDGEVSLSAVEDGKPNGKMKLPWPRNPLIDEVSALDKSKLRKATERILPQIQKVDERDSLLEQIRTKSFNLKPAGTVRPSIQGPTTNLKVAAILEKANAIRQALAGSDEDDDADTWSDS